MNTKGKDKVNKGDLPEASVVLVIPNKLGIHSRTSAKFVKTANQFESCIFVEKDGELVNGKSIMGLMMIAAGPGAKIVIRARGLDAEVAVKALEALVLRKFDEE